MSSDEQRWYCYHRGFHRDRKNFWEWLSGTKNNVKKNHCLDCGDLIK
jgi:hypothetical protein